MQTEEIDKEAVQSFGFSLKPSLVEAAKKQAQNLDRPVSYVVRIALEQYLGIENPSNFDSTSEVPTGATVENFS